MAGRSSGDRLMLLEKGEAGDGGERMITQSQRVTDKWGGGKNRDGRGGLRVCRRGRDAKLCQSPPSSPWFLCERYSGRKMDGMCPRR